MNIANLITSSRLLVTIGVIVCLELMRDVQKIDPGLAWFAFGLFMYAAISDWFDGWVARKYGQETKLGRVIDPFADKFLICGTLICLLRFTPNAENKLGECLETWMVALIVSREFLVTTIRGIAEASGVKFPADRLGKLKMVAQCTAVSALMSMLAGTQFFFEFAYWGMWVTIVLSVVSAAGYVIKAKPILAGI